MEHREDTKNIQDLVPKNKSDTSRIEVLMKLSDKEIEPILPALLEWIQDMNWPVAGEIIGVLALHQDALIPRVLELLRPEEQDIGWKYWIISDLIPCFSKENMKKILVPLERIVAYPTRDELTEEISLVAAEILEEYFPDSPALESENYLDPARNRLYNFLYRNVEGFRKRIDSRTSERGG